MWRVFHPDLFYVKYGQFSRFNTNQVYQNLIFFRWVLRVRWSVILCMMGPFTTGNWSFADSLALCRQLFIGQTAKIDLCRQQYKKLSAKKQLSAKQQKNRRQRKAVGKGRKMSRQRKRVGKHPGHVSSSSVIDGAQAARLPLPTV